LSTVKFDSRRLPHLEPVVSVSSCPDKYTSKAVAPVLKLCDPLRLIDNMVKLTRQGCGCETDSSDDGTEGSGSAA
jgi:hypothetical protein